MSATKVTLATTSLHGQGTGRNGSHCWPPVHRRATEMPPKEAVALAPLPFVLITDAAHREEVPRLGSVRLELGAELR